MSKNKLLSFLNEANHEELIVIPRIGASLADSLIAARPFENLEEAEEIRGINANLLEKMANSLPEEKEKVEKEVIAETIESSSPASDISENTKEILSALKEKVTEESENTRQIFESIPKRFEQVSEEHGVFWSSIISGAVIAFFAILLTLVILGGLNGSLKFSTSSDAKIMQRETTQLTEEVNSFHEELNGLRNRVDTLEGLGERTVALEKAQEALKEELASANEEIENLQDEISILNQEIDAQNQIIAEQGESIQLFGNFFEGLENLLTETFNLETKTETENNQAEEVTEGEDNE
ncbi:MAG: hypothetical protein HN392_09230 [Anaerolineae bacterium]|jgi:predicted  nucleic acid-binding Zn-ribbon protein|nr:hypothetical protein [Anaerolineae bacterium]MBT7076017.1 hypothetical protein [Anaerolineae bacterium]MBT7783889.1 hypothetical protein [Anaerolineae bacterium]